MMHEIFAANLKPGLGAEAIFSGELPEDGLLDFDAQMVERIKGILPAVLGPAYRDAGAHDGSTIYTRAAADHPEEEHDEFEPGLIVSLYDNAVEIAFSLANRPDYLVSNIDEALHTAAALRGLGLTIFDPLIEARLESEADDANARESLLIAIGKLLASIMDAEEVSE